jgi:hypothetical protein
VPVEGLVGVVFHGAAPGRDVRDKCRADGCGS